MNALGAYIGVTLEGSRSLVRTLVLRDEIRVVTMSRDSAFRAPLPAMPSPQHQHSRRVAHNTSTPEPRPIQCRNYDAGTEAFTAPVHSAQRTVHADTQAKTQVEPAPCYHRTHAKAKLRAAVQEDHAGETLRSCANAAISYERCHASCARPRRGTRLQRIDRAHAAAQGAEEV